MPVNKIEAVGPQNVVDAGSFPAATLEDVKAVIRDSDRRGRFSTDGKRALDYQTFQPAIIFEGKAYYLEAMLEESVRNV